ncbi:MAG: hypothetical protein K1X78_20905 [Verrucomicrobiaceae bacterium]|nr:hypothetical protein [Verrucomicrobiaceae bacterium]
MLHDDDLDDFSHLPSVDDLVSAEEKKALWKKHGHASHAEPEPAPHPEPQPEHTHQDEVMEQQLLAHHLPVEQEFIEEHPSHTPEWAEEAYSTTAPSAETQPEVADWVREAFERPPDDAPPVKRTNPVTAPIKQISAAEVRPVREPEKGSPAKQGGEPAAPKTTPKQVKVDNARLAAVAKKGKSRESAERSRTDHAGTKPASLTQAELPSADDERPATTATTALPRADDAAKPRKKAAGGKDGGGAATDAPPKDAGGRDAPADEDPQTRAEVPHGFPHEPEPELHGKERLKKVWALIGGGALTASVLVHIGLLTIAAMWIITYAKDKEVDFLPGGGTKGQSEASASLQHKVQQKKNVWLKNKQPLRRVVSTSISQNITLPDAPLDLDFPDATKLIGSKGMSGGGGFGTGGMGKGFGSGLGFGGKISFMGNTGVGRNVVFVVDVSSSMSNTGDSGTGGRISRFDLLKRELIKTLGRLPPNTQYQVIYFSDFAWPHNEVDSRNLKAFDKYRWDIKSGRTAEAHVPKFRYLAANSANIAHSIDLIKDADNPGGTNWGSGLFMALKAYPKPDIVFFMTDGEKFNAEDWVNEVSRLNLTGGKRSVIHTTAMMEPDAALELDQLAKRNGGNFTIVTAKGFTLTSDEFFKGSGL